MTVEEAKLIMNLFDSIEIKLNVIMDNLFNRLKVAHVIDITDDRVHISKQIVKMHETPDGVVIQIK